ncbi:phosphatase PAP2 family protein [Stenotrophomonas maltophilia group sp. P373]|uniref:undecaprenyl-diphosphate phosphatase n=1 Tax=Stenotrophomonas sepilia TaxID=2860290 RepID=A0ABQ6QD22_9GAMM|nr:MULTISPECIES: phosphatase PAP2 family protein [Stenotrophomonas]GMR28093.1 phosphatase PAP2 family protein [Stenotrophomonas sepilia]AYA89710.1 phosphatase PAP2 family protein [Stenotrophomonas sp. Pemsol]MBN4958089.1 phosphatase PAP2 family protein [Stenotrophomonas maltophilia]MBN4966875.1 phosphatase PAP2 family protein [Stenotrophomonas maltophilia]MCU1005070.1 phosphatase PAP2 family protein [Stenotrophomonas maltophilia]
MRTTPLELLAGREARLCRRANHYCRRRRVRRLFAAISRLGDGVFWYVLMAALVVLDGFDGLRASVHMAATGLAALLLYKGLKRWTRRPRPYAADLRIRAWVAPLDEFSFPSGHTLHAVSFTIVALAYYPWLAPLLVPFTLGVALSRVVLGLHYPSDVLAATGIAVLLASASLTWLPLPV